MFSYEHVLVELVLIPEEQTGWRGLMAAPLGSVAGCTSTLTKTLRM